jgi:hypothetical protein
VLKYRLGEQIRAPFSSRRIEPEPPTPSGYLTLIPLSDARLQPRSTRLTAAFLIAFALLIATIVAGIVFLSVPRSVSVGEISVSADRMSWNTTKASYQLRLVATIPVFNPNYLRASIEGELKVLFYMAEAGRSVFEPVPLSPRALPKLVDIDINASDVPSDYILSILSQCSTFPEVLVFFLKGKLRARYLWQYQHLATIDTYFMISCRDGGTVPSTEKNETAVLDAVMMATMSGLGLEGGGDQSGGGDQRNGGGGIELPVRLNKFM